MDARQKVNFHKYSSGCVGPLKPEVVESTSYDCRFLASSVLILAEEDKYKGLPTGVSNYWLAQDKRTTGQGFTIKLDDCAPAIFCSNDIFDIGRAEPSLHEKGQR